MSIHRRKMSSRGFSLVEMLLVMVIMSVVMLAVMSLYVPVQRSAVMQSQVADVQDNLRLAINRMSQDLLTAGFLVDPAFDSDGGGPLLPGPVYWEGDVNPKDPDDFTIRTRAVGNGFARIIGDPSGTTVPISNPAMVSAFPVGAKVRLFEPVSAEELQAGTVYEVTANDDSASPATITLDALPANTGSEIVMVRIKDDTQPPIQTIRYRLNGDALERIVNGETQFLARNISAVNFTYHDSAAGSVKRIDITIEGQTMEWLEGDAIASQKTRELQTSVTLRNVF